MAGTVAALQRGPTAGPFSLCELCVSVVAIRLIGAIGIRQETAKRRLRTRLASGQVAALQKGEGTGLPRGHAGDGGA